VGPKHDCEPLSIPSRPPFPPSGHASKFPINAKDPRNPFAPKRRGRIQGVPPFPAGPGVTRFDHQTKKERKKKQKGREGRKKKKGGGGNKKKGKDRRAYRDFSVPVPPLNSLIAISSWKGNDQGAA